MVQKFSPSALHHGSVHGCFSARADLFIQKAPTNKVKMRLQTKVSYRSTGTQFSQSSLGGRTATKRPKAGRAVNEGWEQYSTEIAKTTFEFVSFSGHSISIRVAILV